VDLRVNITYSVDLDEVPNEVSRILEECEQIFRAIHGQLDQAIGKEPLHVIDQLDDIRIRLGKLDLKLGDSMEILSGYVSAAASRPAMEQASLQQISPPEAGHEEI
jgi:hypothetical protein